MLTYTIHRQLLHDEIQYRVMRSDGRAVFEPGKSLHVDFSTETDARACVGGHLRRNGIDARIRFVDHVSCRQADEAYVDACEYRESDRIRF